MPRRSPRCLRTTPGATGVQDSASYAAPQMEITFDRARLQSLDVADGAAAQAVQASYGGAVASQIETPDRGLTDIEVIFPRDRQTSLADVLAIPIRSQNGSIVRLGDVASLRYAPAPLLITRENRATVVHVSANVAGGHNLSDVTKDFQKRVRTLHLPRSVTFRPAAQGQQDLMGQALRTLGGSLIISIVLVFLMIVALYNSYRTPFVTLFAIPVATIGAIGALWITHQTLNLYSLIGTVLLVGLVTKNGILLVDYADTVRERDGASRDEGIRQSAQTRFRPIMMTTIAMVAGMLPLALGLEPGGGTRASLAIVVIGGLLSSLVLTLFIVPIMYRWIAPAQLRKKTKFSDDAGKRRRSRSRRRRRSRRAAPRRSRRSALTAARRFARLDERRQGLVVRGRHARAAAARDDRAVDEVHFRRHAGAQIVQHRVVELGGLLDDAAHVRPRIAERQRDAHRVRDGRRFLRERLRGLARVLVRQYDAVRPLQQRRDGIDRRVRDELAPQMRADVVRGARADSGVDEQPYHAVHDVRRGARAAEHGRAVADAPHLTRRDRLAPTRSSHR